MYVHAKQTANDKMAPGATTFHMRRVVCLFFHLSKTRGRETLRRLRPFIEL